MSARALKRIAENKAKHARREDARVLDLAFCEITELPDLSDMDWVVSINLSNNQISDGDFLKGLSKLQYLDLHSNQISNGGFLKGLTNLHTLGLSNNQISNGDFLKGLTNLQSLNLSHNKISNGDFLKGLTNLQTLFLSKNQISSGDFLKGLTNLQTLSLSNNQISNYDFLRDLPTLQILDLSSSKIGNGDFLKGLNNLQSLNLMYNQISDGDFLKELNNLQSLYLGSNQISNGDFLKGLTNLQILNLSSNQIQNYDFLKELSNLQSLYLGNNKINDGDFLKGLTNLQTLNLIYNQISNGDFLKGLTNLQTLNLGYNQIRDLEPFLPLIKKGIPVTLYEFDYDGINLFNNPITNPPLEIVKQGNEAILSYFASFEGVKEEEKIPINEIKILLVGEGLAGKTSLLKQIKGLEFKKEESQTHGIIIEKLRLDTLPLFQQYGHLEGVTGRFWDFGGQEIMHASHQFFLSNRSIYVLVIDSRTDAKKEEWLRHIEKFGGNSPTIITINKIDENRNYDLERTTLNKKFPFIGNRFHRISCAEQEGLSDLAKELAGLIPETKIFKTKFSPAWVAVKEQLEQETAASNYINQQRFEAICVENKVHDKIQQKTLLNYLDSLGIALHFENLGLKSFYVLDPHWVTIGVYKIINSPSIKGGIFEENMLDHILNIENIKKTEYDPAKEKVVVYSDAEQQYLVKIMQKFELLFEYEEGKYLVPDLLPKEPTIDNTFDESGEENIRFVLKYDFFPPTLMPRFIIRMRDDIAEITRLWRSGVELHPKNKRAQGIVKADKSEKRIDICICGSTMDKREYFAFILKILEDIHSTYEKLEVKGWMPVPGYINELVEYEELRGLENMGEDELKIGKLGKKFSVSKDFLDKISTKQQRMEEQKQQGDTFNFNISGGNIGNLSGQQRNVQLEVNQDVQAHDPEIHKKLDRIESTATAIEINTNIIQSNQHVHTRLLQTALELAAAQRTLLDGIIEKVDALPASDHTDVVRIDEILQAQFGRLLERLPDEHTIVAAWKEANEAAPHETDMKWTLKVKIPLIFADIEKDLSWDGKKMLKSIREEFQSYAKGERSFRELFWEG